MHAPERMPEDDGLNRSRDANRLRVLQSLIRHGSLNRAELAQTLGVSRATIAALVTELELAGIVEQGADEPADDRRRALGRPPRPVSLNPKSAFIIALDFGHAHVRAAACDLAGEIAADRWSPSQVDDEPLASLDLAQRLTEDVLAEAGIDAGQVIGAGVGLAVPLDSRRGVIHAAGALPGWGGLRAATELEERLGMPVCIENDANAGALGEHMFGAGRGVEDMAYLRLSAGIGVGLILAGKLYRGTSGVAGEMGHSPAGEGGSICRCGNRGCVETVASPVAIAELLSRSRGEAVSVADLLELVNFGDRGARRAVEDAGVAIGAAIAATVNLLNPQLIVIGGELSRAGDVLLDPIRESVRRRCVAPAAAAVRIVVSPLAERAEVLGAAAIQLARAPEALARRLAATR